MNGPSVPVPASIADLFKAPVKPTPTLLAHNALVDVVSFYGSALEQLTHENASLRAQVLQLQAEKNKLTTDLIAFEAAKKEPTP